MPVWGEVNRQARIPSVHQNGLLPSVPPLAAPLHAEIAPACVFLGIFGWKGTFSRLPPWRAGAGAGWKGSHRSLEQSLPLMRPLLPRCRSPAGKAVKWSNSSETTPFILAFPK